MNERCLKNHKIRGWMMLLVGLVAASGAMIALPSVAVAQSGHEQAHTLMSAWQMDDARVVIDEVGELDSNSPHRHYLEARYAFYMGKYADALLHLDEALQGLDRPDWQQLREVIAATEGVTKDYERHVSPSGRFEIYIEPGRDEVLLSYAFEALEAAYEVMGDELGYRPTAAVRVEVYPRTSVLAEVSLLTHENIRTSGTIALCQYNRLMITSPRAVLRGYSWVDTLVHEYIHYVINQRTTERVPIWMHEGLAKYLERQWRGRDAAMLEASSEHLLRRRMEANDLISFDDMHPSMAKLPSQEDAAVAFAEVYTTMEYLRRELGQGAFSTLLDTMNEGYDAQTAYARVLGTTWSQFENVDWPAYLLERPTPDFDEEEEPYEDRMVFEDQAAEQGNELQQVETPAARDHIQIGQMLQARDRFGAAVVQYQKATQIIGERNPVLQTRLARSLVQSGQPAEAVRALMVVSELFPSHMSTWLELGRAYMAQDMNEEARDALREAARINPFNPEIHQLLARVYASLGESEKADEAEAFRALVRSRG